MSVQAIAVAVTSGWASISARIAGCCIASQ
jgi:hypothetical protein